MTYLDSIILGVVEGLTEFIPVSSTGHLVLASTLLGLPDTEFLKSFEVAIQLGAILAVVVLYWKSFLDIEMLKRLAVAFIPTAIVGFVLYRAIKELIGNPLVVIAALFVGGVAILIIEHFHREAPGASTEPSSLSYKQAFLVGLAQALSVIPGVSRSGATVMGGLLLGISRPAILSFSFLLAVPTMLAATAYDFYKNPGVFEGANLGLLATGSISAFLVALAVIQVALAYVRTRSFAPFGIYRILAAIAFWLLLFPM